MCSALSLQRRVKTISATFELLADPFLKTSTHSGGESEMRSDVQTIKWNVSPFICLLHVLSAFLAAHRRMRFEGTAEISKRSGTIILHNPFVLWFLMNPNRIVIVLKFTGAAT